eukprot:TRINITY_DN76037_c0_g1_i1.p1 TRINITY_DN76037_c0_g1~~TRINITY_DN76037_c0_g1_i1.p1  ORF type:complete len:364 (+),score=42.16 TRINITY_DN76037_c0_g1_i1:71-1162(+)
MLMFGLQLSLLVLHVVLGQPLLPSCPGNTTADDILASANLSGKLALITGGDSGLGYAIAHAFAKRNATVVIATHNRTKGEIAAKEIAALTGADVTSPWLLDLSSLASVRTFASLFLAHFGPKLNLLINNAGIGGPSVIDHDGYELVFEVDYLGHFLLTELLLPSLRNGRPSKVVNVASGAHENACESAGWPEGCFGDWRYLPPPAVNPKPVTVHYRSGKAVVNASSYGIAKFLQTQHSAAVAKREAVHGVHAFSVTPGFALTSMTSGFDPDSPGIKRICEPQVHPDPSLPRQSCPFTPGQGAAVIAFCAVGKAKSGAYYSRGFACEERPVVNHGMTEQMQADLYMKSLEWIGIERQALEQFFA